MSDLKFSDFLKADKIDHTKDGLSDALGLTEEDIDFCVSFVERISKGTSKSEIIEMIINLETKTNIKIYLIFTFGSSSGAKAGKMLVVSKLLKIVSEIM